MNNLKINEGDFVFIKSTSELLKQYRKISPNLPQKSSRPMLCVIKIEENNKLWVVPVTSSNLNKFKERMEHSPDRFRIYNLRGKENCFNISAMIPIRKEDVNNIWINEGKPIKISKENFNELRNHVNNLLKKTYKLQGVSNIQIDKILKAFDKIQEKTNEITR